MGVKRKYHFEKNIELCGVDEQEDIHKLDDCLLSIFPNKWLHVGSKNFYIVSYSITYPGRVRSIEIQSLVKREPRKLFKLLKQIGYTRIKNGK